MSGADRDEARQLSQLIAAVYDAVLQPSLWPDALAQCCGFIRGRVANIFWQDAAMGEVAIIYSFGQDAHFDRLYSETYARLNPFFPALTYLEPGIVYCGEDLLPRSEFVQTRFFKEWVEPQGLVDVLGANLDRSPTSSAMFSIQRGVEEGLVDETAKARMRLIVPHIRRAALVGQLIDQQQLMRSSLAETLSGVAASVFLLNREGGLIFTNAAAGDMLDDATILREEEEGSLAACEGTLQSRFREAMLAAASGDIATGPRGVALPLTKSSVAHWIATIVPLSGGQGRGGALKHATAAVFVRQAKIDESGAVLRASATYKLTRAEADVLRAVLEAGDLAVAAAALGLSRSTIKTHLEHIFAKTHTSSQTQLVKLILGLHRTSERR